MNNQQIKNIKSAIQVNPDVDHWQKIHADENRVFEAAVNGQNFPSDLKFRGRMAMAWWDGLEYRKQYNP